MSGIAIAWTVVGIVAALLVGWGVGVMGIASPDYLQARIAFTLAAITLGAMTLVWATRSDEPSWWRILASVLVGLGVFVVYPEGLRWTLRLEGRVGTNERASVDSVTGGESFCYMTFEGGSLLRGTPRPFIESVGKWPLYDVQVRVVDPVILKAVAAAHGNPENLLLVDAETAIKQVNIGNIPTGGGMLLSDSLPFSSITTQSFNIVFVARNGSWDEQLRLRFVNGHWTHAYRVSKGYGKGKVILKEHAAPDYPREEDGSVAF